MRHDRILFVDDDLFSSFENCEFLRDSGFEVTSVCCAPAAFELIRSHERLAALVTDIDLGLGPDGFEVARRARRAYPGLPIVFISGTAAARHQAEGVKWSEFIAKPLHPQQIVEALGRVTHREAA
jgi:CheY-like chemotaxis protein